MPQTRKVLGMKLEKTEHGWKGDHPLGSSVRFNQITVTKDGGKPKLKWAWMYENADSTSFDTLKDAVEDWRNTFRLPVPRK